MKKILIVTLLVLFSVSLTFGGNGTSTQQRERNEGKVCLKVLNSDMVPLTGTVVSIGKRQCLILETLEGQIRVYGIGPVWYWERMGIDRPETGEVVTVEAYAVPFEDTTRYVAASITIGEQTVDLRDPETGCPIWRKMKRP